MKTITLYILGIGLVIALYSCGTSIPHPDITHQIWAQKHWENVHLDHGREVYVRDCSGCHKLYSPLEHTQNEWVKLFGEMESKTHMSSTDSVEVIAYLQAFSKDTDLKIQ